MRTIKRIYYVRIAHRVHLFPLFFETDRRDKLGRTDYPASRPICHCLAQQLCTYPRTRTNVYACLFVRMLVCIHPSFYSFSFFFSHSSSRAVGRQAGRQADGWMLAVSCICNSYTRTCCMLEHAYKFECCLSAPHNLSSL